jgi:purine/pyrimidine-nucleoside phosphorylase
VRRVLDLHDAARSVLPTMPTLPTQFSDVTVHTKANVYFDGNVVSHTVLFADKTKKTLGLIRPGSYYFGTAAAERMEIVAGACTVTLKGASEVKTYAAGSAFDVAADSGFTIEVASGLCEYICSFLP